jgi:hypothetical protein
VISFHKRGLQRNRSRVGRRCHDDTGVLGVGNNGQTPPANGTPQQPALLGSAKAAKAGKGGKATKPPAMLTQQGEPQLFWGDESPPDPNIIVDGPSKSTDAPH